MNDGGIEIYNKAIESDGRGGGKWCETLLEWLQTRKIDDFEGQKLVKKLKIALNRLLTNQKHVRINMGGSIDHAGSIPEVKSGHLCSEIVKNEDFDGQFFS